MQIQYWSIICVSVGESADNMVQNNTDDVGPQSNGERPRSRSTDEEPNSQ